MFHASRVLLLLSLFVGTSKAPAARFNIEDFGATANDDADDTLAIVDALTACGDAGGGTVFVPAGRFIVTRQGAESPILALPSNTILCGEGAASTLQFPTRASESNFWRMLGHGPEGVRNVTIRDLHLDGGNTHPAYVKGVPEQNHGIFLYAKEAIVENVTIEGLLIENFSGDCIAVAWGCRNITIRDVAMRNFLRQGVQMAGGNGARDYLVTGCHDLEHSIEPGGSTIHVEHARGLQNVQILDNRCRRSILAGGVDGIMICNNVIQGRLVGNSNANAVVAGNIVNGRNRKDVVIQFGYANGLILKDNIVTGKHAEAGGIYVWGMSRYNSEPSRDVVIAGNVVRARGTGILLNGVDQGRIYGNLFSPGDKENNIVQKRSQNIRLD